MRLTRPTMHSPRIPIAMAIVLCGAPLLASAQTYGSSAASQAQVDATESAPVASPPPQKSAQPKKSLMGVVMAALIESAEQTARERHAAARQVTALDQTHDAAPRPDPASVTSRDDAEQVAVQDDPH